MKIVSYTANIFGWKSTTPIGCAQSLQPLEPAPSMTTANIGLISTMPTEYEAQILKLDLPSKTR